VFAYVCAVAKQQRWKYPHKKYSGLALTAKSFMRDAERDFA
jgi:hypothetical protein